MKHKFRTKILYVRTQIFVSVGANKTSIIYCFITPMCFE